MQKAVRIAQDELGTEVSVGAITLGFPKRILIKDLYVGDRAHDTLLYAGAIDVSTDLWQLLHHKILVRKISIDGLRSHIGRSRQDSSFNFDFIIQKFTDTTATKKDTVAVPWTFALGRVILHNSLIRYHDEYGGNEIDVAGNDVDADMDRLDPGKQIYHANRISLSSVDVVFRQFQGVVRTGTTGGAAVPAPGKSDATAFDLALKLLDLDRVRIRYADEQSGQVILARLTDVGAEVNRIDINHKVIDVRSVRFNNSLLSYEQMISRIVSIQNVTRNPQPTATWTILLGDLSAVGNSIQYYDYTQPVLKNAADFSHLWLQQLSCRINGIKVADNQYEATVRELTVSEKSGFQIRKFSGALKVTDHLASLQAIQFQSARSHLDFTATSAFASLTGIASDPEGVSVKFVIRPSVISLKDVAWLAPALTARLPEGIPLSATVSISGIGDGSMDRLSLNQIRIRSLSHTTLQASGTFQHLSDFKHASMQVTLDSLSTTKQDIQIILPDSIRTSLPELPDRIRLAGTFYGTPRTPDIHATLNSSYGDVIFNGKVNLDSAKTPSYRADIVVRKLAIGKIIKNDSIGSVSLTARVDGSGFTWNELRTRIDLNVSEVRYNRYDYKNFHLDGLLANNFFSGKAGIKDKNLDFEMTAELDRRPTTPTYKIRAQLKDADFGALHLTFRPIKARGTLDVDLAGADLNSINGSLAVRNVVLFDGQHLYHVDSLLFASADTKGQTNIKISSDIVEGSFQGAIHLLSLPDVLERHFNSYFSLQDSTHSWLANNQDFKFNLVLKKTDLITGVLFPSIRSFQPSPLTGSFSSAKKQLDIHAEVKRLQLTDLSVQDFVLDIHSTPRSLDASLSLNDFRYDSLKIPGMNLKATVAHDSIKSSITILDSLQKQKYLLATVFNSLKDEFQFRFIPGKVFLNYNEWKVPDDNYIRFHKKSLTAHNFAISRDQEQIQVETKEGQEATVSLTFRQFDLDNIFNIVSGSKSVVSGNLDGTLNLFLSKNNAFKADVKINNLMIMQRAWGDLALTADRITEDKFDLTMTVKGEHSDIVLKGGYVTTKPASTIHLTADLNRIDMNVLEPFAFGQMKKSTGAVSGQLSITGTVAKPSINGAVNFKDVQFLSSYVNSTFSLKNETVAFTGNGMTLSNFRVLDENNNAAVLKGSIQTKNFRDYTLDLNLTTRNFKILNTTVKNNDLYYGKVRLNATAKISGPLRLPVVDLKMSYSDDTEFTYVIPTTSKAVTSQKGIVEFVDKHAPKDTFMTSLHLKDTIQNFIKGFDLTATLQLNDAQKFNIIIDPKSGDKLFLQGSTTLVIKIDPLGNMDLSGQYEISKGSYSFSFYKLVRRDFEILKGGTVTWSGDPFDATFDLQALYKLETSPLELLADNNSQELSAARQSYPFLVYLNIKGQISAPEISFKLDMPEANKGVLGGNVYARIQDINTRESDLNKQVFSLLVLRRFMADDPFENQVSTSISSNARSSVSGILTEQLNRLSQNIKGVQLTVDLKSFDDYTTGLPANQTQLQLGVQKTLLHNKLVVKLAGNVDIAGENTNQNSLTDYIGDLALEYKVNPDGTLRLTGFRNSDYDMIDGELIKTGAGIIYVKDFNALKELFKSNAKDR